MKTNITKKDNIWKIGRYTAIELFNLGIKESILDEVYYFCKCKIYLESDFSIIFDGDAVLCSKKSRRNVVGEELSRSIVLTIDHHFKLGLIGYTVDIFEVGRQLDHKEISRISKSLKNEGGSHVQ